MGKKRTLNIRWYHNIFPTGVDGRPMGEVSGASLVLSCHPAKIKQLEDARDSRYVYKYED